MMASAGKYLTICLRSMPVTLFSKRNQKGLNRNTIQVGDIVGFTRETDEIIGKIERINSKTVSIITADGHVGEWLILCFYSVIEGEKSSHSKLLSINLNKT